MVAVMRQAGATIDGRRARALIVVLWRAGLRISEALALNETDLDPRRGSILVRRGKGGKRRTVGMDGWGWEQMAPWLEDRLAFPPASWTRATSCRQASASTARCRTPCGRCRAFARHDFRAGARSTGRPGRTDPRRSRSIVWQPLGGAASVTMRRASSAVRHLPGRCADQDQTACSTYGRRALAH
jgi:integrase